jgi:hypothetical protein
MNFFEVLPRNLDLAFVFSGGGQVVDDRKIPRAAPPCLPP